jgi:hypothetical protein
MSRWLLAALALALVPACAIASDPAAATKCAGGLGPDARQIYDLVAPEVTPASNIKDLIVAKARPLVMSGKMSRDDARAAANQAGPCLKLLK